MNFNNPPMRLRLLPTSLKLRRMGSRDRVVIKIACLSILMMGSTLRAMDVVGEKVNQAELNNQLIDAAKRGDRQQVEQLIANGAQANAKDKWSDSVLIIALKGGDKNEELCKFLIGLPATNINEATRVGTTPLMLAVNMHSIELCKLLIAKGADVNARTNLSNETVLMRAVKERFKEVYKLLIENGADAYAKDIKGRSALWHAIDEGNEEECRFLIDVILGQSSQQQVAGAAVLFDILKKKGNKDIAKLTAQQLRAQQKYNYEVNKAKLRKEIESHSNAELRRVLLRYLDSL